MGKREVRTRFRIGVFQRDNYTCKICNAKLDDDNLDAHHITDRSLMPNGGYVLSNGITLCKDCHLEAEQYHISQGDWWPEGMHPDELYILINSSHTKAIEDSNKL